VGTPRDIVDSIAEVRVSRVMDVVDRATDVWTISRNMDWRYRPWRSPKGSPHIGVGSRAAICTESTPTGNEGELNSSRSEPTRLSPGASSSVHQAAAILRAHRYHSFELVTGPLIKSGQAISPLGHRTGEMPH
jgi:hypothetical protein